MSTVATGMRNQIAIWKVGCPGPSGAELYFTTNERKHMSLECWINFPRRDAVASEASPWFGVSVPTCIRQVPPAQYDDFERFFAWFRSRQFFFSRTIFTAVSGLHVPWSRLQRLQHMQLRAGSPLHAAMSPVEMQLAGSSGSIISRPSMQPDASDDRANVPPLRHAPFELRQ